MLDSIPQSLSLSRPSEPHDLSVDDLRRVLAFRDWALGPVEDSMLENASILEVVANRFDEEDLGVDRITTAIEWLHTDFSGKARFWVRDEGTREVTFLHADDEQPIYTKSPFYHVHSTRQWLELRLDETPDDLFNIVPDLKRDGYTHYICVPLIFTNGVENGMTFATRHPDGFAPRSVAFLRAVVPTLGAMMELRITHKMFDNVLRFYVGDEPHRQILSGSVRLGSIKRIRSSLFFVDMRNYTGISHGMEPEQVAELLNAFFQCIVPDVVERGGEVMKYMGDGLLAIFRERDGDPNAAARAAYEAAHAVLTCIDVLDASARFDARVEAGIALHHGEAVYGNIGAGQRLDFTVVGRDVNIASRIAGQNRPLRERLLVSAAFAALLDAEDLVSMGDVELAGLPAPMCLYRPARSLDDNASSSPFSAEGMASGRSSAISPRPEAVPAAP